MIPHTNSHTQHSLRCWEYNKHGKVVSKKQSAAAMKKLGGWLGAVAKARKALGCKGFVAIKKGSALYNKAKGFYGKGSPKK